MTAAMRLNRRAHNVVFRLLRGEREPAVCVWKRSIHDFGFFAPEMIAHDLRPHPPRGAELGDLLQKIAMRVEKERQPRRKCVDLKPGLIAAST